MKISTNINAFLKCPDDKCNGLLVHGENYGLISAILQKVHESLGCAKKTYEYCDIVKNPALLLDSLRAPSLFDHGDKKLIIIRGGSDSTISKELRAVLTAKLGHYILITAGPLNNKSSLRAFFEQSPYYMTIACYVDSLDTSTKVIGQWLKKNCPNQIKHANTLAQKFADQDRLHIISELDRLMLLFDNSSDITAAKLLENLEEPDADRESMNRLCEAVLDGNAQAIPTLFAEALSVNDCGLVARSIARHLARIATAMDYMHSGLCKSEAIDKLRPPVFFKQRPAFLRHMAALSIDRVQVLIERIVNAELRRDQCGDVVLLRVLESFAVSR